MRKISKSILSLFALLSLLVLFSSCSTNDKEENITNNGSVELTLNSPLIDVQSKGRMTKTTSTYSEDRVDHIDVFITDKNGYIIPEVGKQRFTASQISNNKIALRTNPAVSPQSFYIVANAPSSLTTGVQTLTDLRRIRHGIIAMESSPFIMTGEVEAVNVQIPSPKVNVQLQRTIARIDIKSAPAVTNFEIVNVELRNTSDVIYLFPRNPVDYMGSLVDFKTPIPATDSKSVLGKVYAFENYNADLNNIANTTCVIVGGYYNGDRSKLTYYRIDVLGNDNTARILRGACYTLNINQILGKGWDTADDAEANKAENIIYTIDHWIDQSNNSVFDGQNYISINENKLLFWQEWGEYAISIKCSNPDQLTYQIKGNFSVENIEKIIETSTDVLLLITISSNYTNDYIRGSLDLKIGNLTLSIPAFQHADDERPWSPSDISFIPEGETKTHAPTLGKGWNIFSVSKRPTWIQLSNFTKKTVDLTASPSTTNRSGLITVMYQHEETKESVILNITASQFKKDTYYIAASTNTDVNLVQGAGSYDANATCTLVAPNIAGYTFSHWEENGTNVSSNATYTFTVTANRSLRAIYKYPFEIKTILTEGVLKINGSGHYLERDDVEFFAHLQKGYIIDYWQYKGKNDVSYSNHNVNQNPMSFSLENLNKAQSPYTFKAVACYPLIKFIANLYPSDAQSASSAEIYIEDKRHSIYLLHNSEENINKTSLIPALTPVRVLVDDNAYIYNTLTIYNANKSQVLSTHTKNNGCFYISIPEQHCILQFNKSGDAELPGEILITIRTTISGGNVLYNYAVSKPINTAIRISGKTNFRYESLDDYYPDSYPTEKDGTISFEFNIPANQTNGSYTKDPSGSMDGLNALLLSIKSSTASPTPSQVGLDKVIIKF